MAASPRTNSVQRLPAILARQAMEVRRLLARLAGASGSQSVRRLLEKIPGDQAASTAAQVLVFREVLEKPAKSHNCLPQEVQEVLAALDVLARRPEVAKILGPISSYLATDVAAKAQRRLAAQQAVLPQGLLFEQFLRELDCDQRRRRGVFHTPQPVARFIVRSVLQLVPSVIPADKRVQFIDPACGCGTFLAQLTRELAASHSSYDLRTSSFAGFEVLPAAWLISHLLLARGFDFPSPVPCLLSPVPCPLSPRLLLANPLLAGPALAPLIADSSLFPVILGNPPYANFGRQNRGAWILSLLDDYKRGLAERKLNLDDDFIKFIRWGQFWTCLAGGGILALVTSNTYLRGLTHRRMRESLLTAFDDLYVLDLHGSSRRETAPGGERDENVFPIRSGVAIGIFVKRLAAENGIPGGGRPQVHFAELGGTRQEKFAALKNMDVHSTAWKRIAPESPEFLLAAAERPLGARGRAGGPTTQGYRSFWPLPEIFQCYISGVQTKNDELFVGFTRDEVGEKVARWLRHSAERGARNGEQLKIDESFIRPYMVAPLDRRWIYYDPPLLGRARHGIMRHMLEPNVGLVFMRQSTNPGQYDHFLAVDCLVSDRVFYSAHGAPFLAPLWVGDQGAGVRSQEPGVGRRQNVATGPRIANFTPAFLAAMNERLVFEPAAEDLFAYLYGSAWSPAYRTTFGSELKTDFPRIPLPRSADQFQQASALGNRLIELHLSVTRPGPRCEEPPTTAFSPTALSTATESFRVGGYPVIHRWLRQRRGRDLSLAEQQYLSRLTRVAEETQRLIHDYDSASFLVR